MQSMENHGRRAYALSLYAGSSHNYFQSTTANIGHSKVGQCAVYHWNKWCFRAENYPSNFEQPSKLDTARYEHFDDEPLDLHKQLASQRAILSGSFEPVIQRPCLNFLSC